MAVTETTGFGQLVEELDREVDQLDRELAEIELLMQQARIEAARHEQKRAQIAGRVGEIQARGAPPDLRDATAQLISVTKRASLMDAQLDLLEG